jgi:hypothetical protein
MSGASYQYCTSCIEFNVTQTETSPKISSNFKNLTASGEQQAKNLPLFQNRYCGSLQMVIEALYKKGSFSGSLSRLFREGLN